MTGGAEWSNDAGEASELFRFPRWCRITPFLQTSIRYQQEPGCAGETVGHRGQPGRHDPWNHRRPGCSAGDSRDDGQLRLPNPPAAGSRLTTPQSRKTGGKLDPRGDRHAYSYRPNVANGRDSHTALTEALFSAVQASGGDIGARAGARAPILPTIGPFAR
jgi:hypothetical protein